IEADLVDCIVSMPGQLFFSTQIPVSLWFLAKNRRNGFGQEGKPLRDRSGEMLFIDARQIGELEDRTHRVLSDDDIATITGTYHAWRGDGGEYEDVPGFCKTTPLEEVRAHGHVLTPGRYVGAAAMQDDGEPFGEKMDRLTNKLEAQFEKSASLEAMISENLVTLRTTTNGREHE
ncbi:MAG: N-6 DNA methylase, partial [Chloroflexia bacterium]|nr:N-6 DNA methylase [Chloroflexia bacterium]